MMRRSKTLALFACAPLLALAACGGSDDGDGGGGGGADREFESAATEIVKDAERAAPAAEVDGAEQGGEVTVYLPSDPGPNDLDPTNGWSVTGNSIQEALTHRSLTQYARNPESGQMELVPDLATDLGTPNEDFTEWTFTLRDGVRWENGQDITPEEVAFGIERSLDAKAFPSGPGTEYSKNYFAGGADYDGPYTAPNENYDGIEVDGRDIIIKMSKPFPDMDWWGAFMAMGPAPLGNASAPPAYGRKPLANGPYKVVSFRPTRELVLERNEEWDPQTDPGRHQYVDRWVFKFDADPQQTDEILLSGNEASATSISAAIQAENYSRGQEVLGDNLIQQTAQCVSYDFPVYEKTTPEIRKALAYAYDYEAIWTATGEIPGVTRVPADSIMAPGMSGKPDYFVDGEQITYDPEKAKELMAEAGHDESNPFEVVYIYDETDPLAVAGSEQRTRGYEEAGFTVRAIPVQVSLYDIWLDPDNATNQQLTMRGVNWCSDWPSGLTVLPSLLRTGSPYNTGGYSNPEVDARMDEIPTLPAEEQADAWGALDEQISTDEYPLIPTAYRNDLFTAGSRIGNFTGDGAKGAPNYRDIYVASE